MTKKLPTTDDKDLAEPIDLGKAADRQAIAEYTSNEKKALERELDAAAKQEEEVVYAGGPPRAPRALLRDDEESQRFDRVRDVRLTRTRVEPTKDQILWILIRDAANRISFPSYLEFINGYLAHTQVRGPRQASLPFSHVNAYGLLKSGTETFLETHCGIVPPGLTRPAMTELHAASQEGGRRTFEEYTPDELALLWEHYTVEEPAGADKKSKVQLLPYMDIIRRKLGEYDIESEGTAGNLKVLFALIQERLANPPMLELFWSYWHEEGMLAQTMAAIARRFQNIRGAGRDPLANLELDPLRPLNNILWGYLQDEQHRLSVMRRAYEYDHHYGFTLHGKALKNFRPADSRSRFLEAFHNLLHLTNTFYKQDDDTTVVADGFPLLAALKDVHILLTQGGHNQCGDLPWTARQEMLMEQWILSRPEMREFIGGRIMVAYPEQWMDRVDSMKSLQGWDDTSSIHFRDLAAFGEQILLSIRYGAWVQAILPAQAANWGRFWRPEIQMYLHAYRAVTGVDLTTDATDARPLADRNLPPSVHLRNRLLAQGRAR